MSHILIAAKVAPKAVVGAGIAAMRVDLWVDIAARTERAGTAKCIGVLLAWLRGLCVMDYAKKNGRRIGDHSTWRKSVFSKLRNQLKLILTPSGREFNARGHPDGAPSPLPLLTKGLDFIFFSSLNGRRIGDHFYIRS